ncbi:hypothetical protein A9G41_01780 [Gilliamella sp. Nev5-1]|nr:hypothetical protein A9G40_00445 [Gilliamella apicola]OCG71800.1 hypothetical protein A9G41_01780 [Gilliamella apicola]
MPTLAICLAPYKLIVSTSALYVQTLYGMPNQGKMVVGLFIISNLKLLKISIVMAIRFILDLTLKKFKSLG